MSAYTDFTFFLLNKERNKKKKKKATRTLPTSDKPRLMGKLIGKTVVKLLTYWGG